ncbi:MAG TPA: ABC transporter permease [Candidatus Binatia bacterium]|jgi:putative ABC transport system permease protein|nr:ABC transporter permease [Candidatus Binatia bacterium]
MTARDVVEFALRAFRGHRLRAALSLLGVAVGVAAVVLLTALGNGARRYVTDQFASIGSNLLIVMPGKTETTGGLPFTAATTRDLTLADAEAVARLPGVERIAPIAMATETVAHEERRRQVAVVGTTPEFLTVRHLTLGRGSFLPPGELRRGVAVVVVGNAVARELFPGVDPVGKVMRIGDMRARVVGVMAPMGEQLGMNLDETVTIPVARAMRLFNRASLFRIMIEVRAHADLETVRRDVVRLLAARHREEDVTVITQEAVMSSFGSILQALTLALAGIAAISLTVAGLGIMNVMLVAVSERTVEVGLLRAVGAGQRQVQAVFLAEAALLATAGGVAGLGVGLLAVLALRAAVPVFPAEPPLWAVVSSLGVSVVVGVVFGLLPARRAARLDPVAALGGH